jgi:hypothetical protein
MCLFVTVCLSMFARVGVYRRACRSRLSLCRVFRVAMGTSSRLARTYLFGILRECQRDVPDGGSSRFSLVCMYTQHTCHGSQSHQRTPTGQWTTTWRRRVGGAPFGARTKGDVSVARCDREAKLDVLW